MIEATVVMVKPGKNGCTARVFARSHKLVSPENADGEVMFYGTPPFWTDGHSPRVGQQVVIGQIERKTSPYWSYPKWLARDVSPAFAVRQYSHARLNEPTTQVCRPQSGNLIERVLSLVGLRTACGARSF